MTGSPGVPFWLVELIETSGSSPGSVVVVVVAGVLVVVVGVVLVVVVGGVLVLVVGGVLVVVVGGVLVLVVGGVLVVVVVGGVMGPQSAGRFATSNGPAESPSDVRTLTAQGTGTGSLLRIAQFSLLSTVLPKTWS